jgi:uncharacterized membrane protein YoaK (UPF0700 family)
MENKNVLFTSAFKGGLIIAAIGIVIFLVEYAADIMPIGILKPLLIMLFSLAVSIIVLVILVKNFRKKQDGVLTFKDAFLFCLIAMLTSAIIGSLFSYLFMQFFDPHYMTRIMEAQRNWMENYLTGKVSDQQLTDTLNKMDEKMKNTSILKQTMTGMIWNVVFSAIIALIVGAAMKKNPNVFEEKGGVI